MFDIVNREPDRSGKLLSSPDDEPVTYTRRDSEYVNNSDKFLLKEKNFTRQYAHVYSARLMELRPVLEEVVKKKFGSVPVVHLFELKVGEECIVIGTLFKHMEMKPNILKEISEEHHLVTVPADGRYTDDEDRLILEDELQRITLKGSFDIHKLATGAIVAIRGMEHDDDRGKFNVKEFCFLGLSEQQPRPELDSDCYVALVSGLELGSGHEDSLAHQLMIDLLAGHLGDEGQQEELSKCVRVIVAGNSLSKSTQDKDICNKAKYLTKNSTACSVDAIRSLDNILIQLAACMDVDIMPGEFDPANFTFPQQPLHRCMFPKATRFPTLQCVTNPYDCTIEGVRIMGTSGQPAQDIWKFSRFDEHLDILEKTLEWRHLAPTAPDTLGCYPYTQNDPFILSECPHLYFSGNHPKFSTKLYEGKDGQKVRLVTVPRFSDTKTIVLVNLRTMECRPVSFDCHLPEPMEESPVDK